MHCHFHNPVSIHSGPGMRRQIGALAAKYGKKALIVTTGSAHSRALAEEAGASLEAAGLGWAHYNGIRPNPLGSMAAEGAQAARDNGCDMVIGIGGGSVMDASKGIAFAYYNDAPIDHRDNMSWGEANKKYIRRFEDCARSCGIPTVKLHTGQRFFVRNLRFDVLCTQEDVWPKSLENFNNTSCALALEADGTRIIFPGDAADVESDIMTARYTAKTLGCDIMQQSHHGHSGTSPEFYQMANARTVMFPITKIKFDEEYPKQEANRVACSIAEEYFIASDGTVEFPLPYKVGSAKIYPDETFENFAAIKMLWGYDYPDEYKKQLFEEFLRRGGLPALDEIEA